MCLGKRCHFPFSLVASQSCEYILTFYMGHPGKLFKGPLCPYPFPSDWNVDMMPGALVAIVDYEANLRMKAKC